VRYTTFGPLPFDNDASNPLRDYALRWIAHNVTEMSVIDGFEKLNSMGSHADYLKAIAGIDAPAQNVVFASRSGDIAIQVQGRLPIRQKEQGRFLQEGTQSANNLTQFIPQSELPGMKNPSRGFVFSANQHSTPPSYPYYFLADFEDYRSRRIFNRLTNMQSATVDSMKTMQLDNFSQKAADALPAMLRLLDKKALDSKELEMVGVLESWNFRYDGNLLAPTLFEVWSDSCYMLTWDEMAAINKPILFPDGWRWIEMLQNDTSSVFFDIKETPGRETARQIVLESFKQMKGFFDKNPTQKVEWRSFRPFELRHLTQLPAFSRLDLKPSGHKTAPNAVSMKNGPSWRMIVEYEDQIKALGVYPGGQSGNPGSQWYDNMAEMWAKGEYCELLFLKDQTENSPRIIGKQRFVPAS
jgi:penicillin amidase